MARVKVKYTGRGNEIFPSLRWSPQKGDEIELDESLVDPRRMKVVQPKPPPRERAAAPEPTIPESEEAQP